MMKQKKIETVIPTMEQFLHRDSDLDEGERRMGGIKRRECLCTAMACLKERRKEEEGKRRWREREAIRFLNEEEEERKRSAFLFSPYTSKVPYEWGKKNKKKRILVSPLYT